MKASESLNKFWWPLAQSLLAAQRRTTYEIAELEEAHAEAAELWHSGALRQLRQVRSGASIAMSKIMIQEFADSRCLSCRCRRHRPTDAADATTMWS